MFRGIRLIDSVGIQKWIPTKKIIDDENRKKIGRKMVMSPVIEDIFKFFVVVINPVYWYLDSYGSISTINDIINCIVAVINLGLLSLAMYGSICKKINSKKGYSGGFAWGFLGIIGIIILACRKQPLKQYSGTMSSHPYRKLGGFLMYDIVSRVFGFLFWVGIGIIELVMYTHFKSQFKQMTIALLPAGDRDLITALILTVAVFFVIAFITDLIQVIMILSRSKWFLMFYQLMCIVCIIIAAVFFAVCIAVGVDRGYQTDWTMIILHSLGLIPLAIKALLWSHYYSHSVRVRVFMGSSDYLRKSIFNRKTMSPISEFDENGY